MNSCLANICHQAGSNAVSIPRQSAWESSTRTPNIKPIHLAHHMTELKLTFYYLFIYCICLWISHMHQKVHQMHIMQLQNSNLAVNRCNTNTHSPFCRWQRWCLWGPNSQCWRSHPEDQNRLYTFPVTNSSLNWICIRNETATSCGNYLNELPTNMHEHRVH